MEPREYLVGDPRSALLCLTTKFLPILPYPTYAPRAEPSGTGTAESQSMTPKVTTRTKQVWGLELSKMPGNRPPRVDSDKA